MRRVICPESTCGQRAGLARALGTLADKKISHRDIKPKNILWYEGHAVISDFGLVRFPGKKQVTGTRTQVGPNYYLAPEMAYDSKGADGCAADVWSLAKTLWVLVSGQFPLWGSQPASDPRSQLGTFSNHARTKMLDVLIERCTLADPRARPSMREVANELEAWLRMDDPKEPGQPVDLSELLRRLEGAVTPAIRERQHRDALGTRFWETRDAIVASVDETCNLFRCTKLSNGQVAGDAQRFRLEGANALGSGVSTVDQYAYTITAVAPGYPGEGQPQLHFSFSMELLSNEECVLNAMYRWEPGSISSRRMWHYKDRFRLGSAEEALKIREFGNLAAEKFPDALAEFIEFLEAQRRAR